MEGTSKKRQRVAVGKGKGETSNAQVSKTAPAPAPKVQGPPVQSSGQKRKVSAGRRQWTKIEDAALVECLLELNNDHTWKGENGFRTGYLNQLEKMLESKLPASNLKATPHIESRYKLLKRQFHAINEMIANSSGFGWNATENCVTASKDVYEDWCKSHPTAVGLRNKEFPHLEDLRNVWGKDHATGAAAETPADAVEAIDKEDEIDDYEDDNEEGFQDTINLEEEPEINDSRRAGIDIPDSSAANTGQSRKPATRSKKRSKSDDGLSDLVGELHNYVLAHKVVGDHIDRIATYFQKETEGGDRRMNIFEEIQAIPGFSRKEVMEAGEHILKDNIKVDTFFAMPKDFRRDYVVKQLAEANPYRPSFDFSDVNAP